MKTKLPALLASLLLLSTWSGLVPATRAALPATSECCALAFPPTPNNLMDFSIAWAYPPEISSSFLTVTVLVSGAVSPGVYASWCGDAQTALLPGIEGYEYVGNIYSSTDTNLNQYLTGETANTNSLVGPDAWKSVNYILNHRVGYDYWDVQGAIWHFVGGPAVSTPPYPEFNLAAVSQLVSDTISNAPAWVSQHGDKVAAVAVIVWPVDTQIVIIEVPCPETMPGLGISVACPTACGMVEFNGSVSNSGNVTLTNVQVFSSQPSENTLVAGPLALAPGASATFTGNYIVPCITNLSTNTVSIVTTNTMGVISTNTVFVVTTNTVGAISTNTVLVVTTNIVGVIVTNNTTTVTTNAVTPTFGTVDPVGTALIDRFNVVDNLHGLMFADQDQNWGPTLFYSIRYLGSDAAALDTISTIPPFASVVTDRFGLSSTNYDALTLAAPDVGYGAKNFYYIRHDPSGVCTFGVIKAAGASSSADLWVVAGTGYKAIAFAEADLGYGANLFYFIRQDISGLCTFGTIDPTPGGIVTDRYTVGTNFDALVFVPGAVATWGSGIFAYLRHDNTGSIIGTIDPVTHVVTDRINLGTNFLDALTFTATDVGYGPNLFYYLRPGTSTVTSNTVTSFSTNELTSFTTNEVTSFTTNFVTSVNTNEVTSFSTNFLTSFSTNEVTSVTTNIVATATRNTVTASGTDACQGRTVNATAACSGAANQVAPLVIRGGGVAPLRYSNGDVSLSFGTQSGVTYIVQFKNAMSDPAWTDLQTVVGTGGIVTIPHDMRGQSACFYRVVMAR